MYYPHADDLIADILATVTAVKFIVNRDVYVIENELTPEMKLHFQPYEITQDILQLSPTTLFLIPGSLGHTLIITNLHQLKFSRQRSKVVTCMERLKQYNLQLHTDICKYVLQEGL